MSTNTNTPVIQNDEANLNVSQLISRERNRGFAQHVLRTEEEGVDHSAMRDDRTPTPPTISEDEILEKVKDFERDIYTYDDTLSLFNNIERAKIKKAELDQYLRSFGELTPSIIHAVNHIDINKVRPPRKYININNLLTSKVVEAKISGDNYMSIFKAQKYLLNTQQDITEIKNFFYVIDKNNSSVLLKSFKDNKQALINIIVGLIKITFAYKVVEIKYENSYDLIYKNQLFDNVVFDFDMYTTYKEFVFLKKINDNIVKIKLSLDDFKRSDLKIKNENARSTENMVAEEIPKSFELEIFESKEYEDVEHLEFSKELLEKFIKNNDFKNKVIDFIDGAFLIYPEILQQLPENISLKKDDFKLFEYLSDDESTGIPLTKTE